MTLPEIHRALLPHLPDLARELLPGGAQSNGHWKSETLEVDLNTGVWHDSESQEEGDILDLIASVRMLPLGKAATWATEWLGPPAAAPAHEANIDRQMRRAALGLPVNDGEFDPLEVGFKSKDETVWRHGTKAFTYRSATGSIIGYSVLFENGQILPLRIIDGKPKWTGWKHPALKPIYNIHLLAQRPESPVIICGSEPAADAASRLFPDAIALSWLGRPANVSSCDWTPISDRISDDPSAKYPDGTWANPGGRVILWPDANKPGREAMLYLKARLPSALMVRTEDLPDGWNLDLPAPKGISVQALFDAAGLEDPAPKSDDPAPFRLLGHDESGFFYHSHLSGHLVHFTASEHTELNLQLIAPDSYWLSKGFHQDKGDGVDYKAVAKHLIALQLASGHFDTAKVRGLGCWVEPAQSSPGNESIVYHAGDRLFVNGIETPIIQHRSDYIYPRRRTIAVDFSRVATPAEGQLLLDICDLMPWAPNQLPWAFAAWHFLAPIAGALDWRPPGWVCGPSKAGKSWIFSNFTSPLIGDSLFKILSATTAPGVRQGLSCDALPVAGDEIEPNSPHAQKRIAGLCDLVRQATSETGGSIYHGTTDGTGRSYRIRSCFLFSSIVPGMLETADENRFAKFEFHVRDDQDAFERLAAMCLRIPDVAPAIRARAIRLVREIRIAARIFTRAVARAARDSRKGQQFGTFAGGAWMLIHDTPPTPEQAEAWCATVNWNLIGHDSSDDDATRAIDVLMAYRSYIQDNDGRRHDHTVGELIDLYFSDATPSDPRQPFAYDALMRLGIHPMANRHIDVAVRWPELRRVFQNTQFADHWTANLRQLQGACDSVFKASGNRSIRAVRLPL